jgi:hypothetical protein
LWEKIGPGVKATEQIRQLGIEPDDPVRLIGVKLQGPTFFLTASIEFRLTDAAGFFPPVKEADVKRPRSLALALALPIAVILVASASNTNRVDPEPPVAWVISCHVSHCHDIVGVVRRVQAATGLTLNAKTILL